jgi:ABC-type glutathione transport system ATPase component
MQLITTTCDRVGASAVLVSHRPQTVGRFTHRVIVLSEGKVIEEGDTKIVFEDPHREETVAMLAASGIDSQIRGCSEAAVRKS